MFTTKELGQLLFALTVRADRMTQLRDQERELELHGEEVGSPAYWNACLETMAQARSRIEIELASRDHAELVRINDHFRVKRTKALMAKAVKDAAKAPKKSKTVTTDLPDEI